MNRQLIKPILTLLVLVVLACSCNKTENDSIVRDGKIRVKAAMQSHTKALATGFPLDEFRFFKLDATASPASFVGAESSLADIDAAGNVAFATQLNYNNDVAQKAWLVGFYPAGDLVADKLTWTVDGKTDILCQKSTFNAGDANAPIPTGLTFIHRLSRVEVVCKADPKLTETIADLRVRWGKIEKIEIVNSANTATLSLATPFVFPTPTAFQDLAMLAHDYTAAMVPFEVPEATNTTVNAAAIVLTAGAADFQKWTLRVSFSGGTNGAKALLVDFAPTILETSKIHTVTLSITSDHITVKATVADWTTQTVNQDV